MNRLDRYIAAQLLKSTLIGSLVALVALLGLQFLRLSELIIKIDVEADMVVKMLMGLGASFIPLVFPIAFLFALLGVFSRLTIDREFTALTAMGWSLGRILRPAYIVGLLISIITAWTSFTIGPRGNQQFEIFIDEAFRRKVTSSLRSGTFAEGFLGLVVFVDHVDQTMTQLDRVFIHDATNFKESVSISAQKGQWVQSPEEGLGILRLKDGVMISQEPEKDVVRRVEFDEYNIYADFSRQAGNARESPPSLEWKSLLEKRAEGQKHPEIDPRPIWVELSRRLALSFVSLCFVPLTFAFCFDTSRSFKPRAVFVGLVILVSYWTLYFSLVTWLLKSPWPFTWQSEAFDNFVIWMPNFIVLFIAQWRYRQLIKRA